MSKQLKKFCRITKYIEKTDPKLFEILEDLCALSSIRPRRGHSGISFIYPSKATIEKIDKLRYSDQIESGVDIVLGHVIHDFLKTPADWNAKKSDIPNGLDKKVEVKEVKGTKIILADGAELELDTKFVPFSERGNNQAVYRVVKGDVDHTKHTKRATFEHARTQDGAPRKPMATHGGSPADLQSEVIQVLKSTLCKKLSESEDCKHEGAVAPFSFLIHFDKFIQEGAYSDEVKCMSKLIHCGFTPVTNTYFALSGTCLDSALADFITDCQNKDVKFLGGIALEGASEYRSHCKSNFDHLCKSCEGSVAGGGYRDSFAVLQKALSELSKAHAFHLGKLLKKDVGCDDPKAKWFASLCWSRCFECCEIKKVKDSGDDVKESIHDMCDVIQDLSLNKNSDDVASDRSLQPMITAYLEAAQEFSKDNMCCFPLKSKASSDQAYQICHEMSELYSDDSAAKLLRSLSPEQLASLLSQ